MIRLIASDLDGSLLPSDKRVPSEFFRFLPELEKRGITFFTASGRTYPTLCHDFSSVSDQIGYLCENGACVIFGGKQLVSHTIPREILPEIFETIRSLSDVQLVLCGTRCAYHKAPAPKFGDRLRCYYVCHEIISDYEEAEDDFYKLAICDLKGPENNSYPVFRERFGDRLNLFVSGPLWMDIMIKGVDKGTGLSEIQKTLGIRKEETMAFGDYYNDVPLLAQAGIPYLMKNAPEDLKASGKYRITEETNEENGVLRTILEYLSL